MFWPLQIGGWTAYALSSFFTFLPQSSFPIVVLLQMKLLRAALGCAITVLFRVAALQLERRQVPIRHQSIAFFVAALICGPAWLLAYVYGVELIFPGSSGTRPSGFSRASLDYIYVLLLWVALFFGARMWNRQQQAERLVLEASSRARVAELEMLRYQLNPHFVFNALNSIRALIPEQAADARRIVNEFSELLRYTLRPAPRAPVTIDDELAAIKRYLSVEQIRYDSTLSVNYDIDPGARAVQVPGFTLQPLVENALRHGRARATPFAIRIGARLDGDQLVLEVMNTGSLNRFLPGTGTGLANLRERLQRWFRMPPQLTLTEESGWVCARIRIDKPWDTCAPS